MIALSKFTRQNVEVIRSLHPDVQPLFLEFLWRIAMSGIYVRIASGFRTSEEQHELFLKGRPWLKNGTHGKKVTWVLCPDSWHCHGLAIDIAPLKRVSTLYYQLFWPTLEDISIIARELGIEWGFALWGRDKPHFHYSKPFDPHKPPENASINRDAFKPEFKIEKKPKKLVRAFRRMGLTDDGVHFT